MVRHTTITNDKEQNKNLPHALFCVGTNPVPGRTTPSKQLHFLLLVIAGERNATTYQEGELPSTQADGEEVLELVYPDLDSSADHSHVDFDLRSGLIKCGAPEAMVPQLKISLRTDSSMIAVLHGPATVLYRIKHLPLYKVKVLGTFPSHLVSATEFKQLTKMTDDEALYT